MAMTDLKSVDQYIALQSEAVSPRPARRRQPGWPTRLGASWWSLTAGSTCPRREQSQEVIVGYLPCRLRFERIQ